MDGWTHESNIGYCPTLLNDHYASFPPLLLHLSPHHHPLPLLSIYLFMLSSFSPSFYHFSIFSPTFPHLGFFLILFFVLSLKSPYFFFTLSLLPPPLLSSLSSSSYLLPLFLLLLLFRPPSPAKIRLLSGASTVSQFCQCLLFFSLFTSLSHRQIGAAQSLKNKKTKPLHH